MTIVWTGIIIDIIAVIAGFDTHFDNAISAPCNEAGIGAPVSILPIAIVAGLLPIVHKAIATNGIETR